MKKTLSWILIILMLMMCGSALAEGGQSAELPGVAFITNGTIYYSGSVDGSDQGIFSMDMDGNNAKKLYDSPISIMTATSDRLLVWDWDVEALILLDLSGAELARFPAGASSALAKGDMIYCGSIRIDAKSAAAETIIEASGDESWMLNAVAVTDDAFYFLDDREYAMKALEYGSMGALMRMSLADKSITQISGPGTKYIGMDDQYLYYTREDFLYIEGDASVDGGDDNALEKDTNPGLYRANLDGSGELKLAECGTIEEDSYTDYSALIDGVIYGMYYDFVSEDYPKKILRVTREGEKLSDIEASEDVVNGLWNGKLILTENVFDETDDYNQKDRIIALDLADLSRTVLNPDERYILFFTELDPVVAVIGDKAYFTSANPDDWSQGLYMLDLSGGGVKQLAKGIGYE